MKSIEDLAYIPVIIALGQSNAEGRAPKANAPEGWLNAAQGSLIWKGVDTGLEAYDVGQSGQAGNQNYPDVSPAVNSTQFGPISIAIQNLEKRYDQPFVVFQYAIGGQALLKAAGDSIGVGYFDPQENGLWNSVEREWRYFTKHIEETYGMPIRVEFAFWCQGEADHVEAEANRGTYKAALNRLIASTRTLAANDDLPFIIMMPVRYDLTSSSGPQNWVRYEQAEIALEDANVAVTTCAIVPNVYGATLNDVTIDLTHINAPVMIQEGNRIANIYAAMLAGVSAPSAVTGLAASGQTDTTIDLSWTGSGSREYIITVDGTVSGFTTGNSITIDGLTAGTSYTFRVYAHNLPWETAYAEITTATTGAINTFDVILDNAPSEAAAISAYQAMHTLDNANKPTPLTNATAGTIGATQVDDYYLPYCLLGDGGVEFNDRMGGRDGVNMYLTDGSGYVTHYVGMHGAGGSAQLLIHTFPSALMENLDFSAGWGSSERISIPGLSNREYEFLQRCAVDASTGYIYGMDTADTSGLWGTVLKRFNAKTKATAETVDTSWISGNFRMMSDDSDMREGLFVLESEAETTNGNGVSVKTIYLLDRDGNEVATFVPEDVYDYVSPMPPKPDGTKLVMIQYKKSVSTFNTGTTVYEIDEVNDTLINGVEYTVSQNHMTGRFYIDDAGTMRPAIAYTISSGVRKNQLGLGSSFISGTDQNQMVSYVDGSDTLQYKKLTSEALTALPGDDEQFCATPNSNVLVYSHHNPDNDAGTVRGVHLGIICRSGSGATDSPRPFYAFDANTNTSSVSYHSRSHISPVMPNGAFVAVFRGVLDTGSSSHSFVKIFPAWPSQANHDTLMAGTNPF